MAFAPMNVLLGQQKLFYFTGKVRSFWKNKIFFLDQRNAAIIDLENLYINGEKASEIDLHCLDAQVASSDWQSAPELHSYVERYNSNDSPPWPYKLKGKKLWLAHHAWIGHIPEAVISQTHGQNVVYMPITYYTGKVINLFGDKLLYGDYRNNVMVHLSDLHIYGQRADYRDVLMNFDQETPVIHSFVTSLKFLTDNSYEGPEPNLPTWPVDEYGPSTWVAKFAWQGEMPDQCRLQLSRFQIIKMHEWNSFKIRGWIIPRPFGTMSPSHHESFSVSGNAKGRVNGTIDMAEPLLATTKKEAAIVKGTLLLANHEYGLINSYLDVIVFSTKNFYVNGEKFRDGSLDDFFHERKVPLTAWIVPLPEPVLVFDVYVMWRAVCVWYGIPPKNMESIKNRYDKGSIAGSVPEALNTKSDNRYTLVLGEVTSVTYNIATAIAKVGQRTIDITIKRKAVYMNGYKLHTRCSLTAMGTPYLAGILPMLVYPSGIDDGKTVKYTALALWQYQYQHLVCADLLYRILLEGGSISPIEDPQNTETGSQSEEDKMGRHMTGMIVKTCPKYGVIETKSVTTLEPSYVFFLRTDLYVDGKVPIESQMVNNLERKRQVNLYARSAKHQQIKTFPITMYATLVWMGKKPAPAEYSSLDPSINLPGDDSTSVSNGHLEEDNQSSESPGCESPGEGNFQKALEWSKPGVPILEHKTGKFVFLKDRYGVIKCGNKTSGYTCVLFDFSVLWIEGDRLTVDESLCPSIIKEVQCSILAYIIPSVDVGGHQVTMQATAVWLGNKPFHIELPLVTCPVKAMEDINAVVKGRAESEGMHKKIKEYKIKLNKSGKASTPKQLPSTSTKELPSTSTKEIPSTSTKEIPSTTKEVDTSEVTDALASVSVNDTSVEEIESSENLEDLFLNPKKPYGGIVIDPKKPYFGKHISGRIVKLVKGRGIAMWRCAAKDGEVYIVFSKKNVYVNLCPMDVSYKVNQGKSCNFYVIPVQHKNIEGYRVSLYATCGWIGSKPHDIPSAGEQEHSHITLDNVYFVQASVGKHVVAHMVKLNEATGIARWRSTAHGGDVYIEFEKMLTCDTIQSYFGKDLDEEALSQRCQFFVRPMPQKEMDGYVVSLSIRYGWIGKKPTHFPKPQITHQPTLLAEKLHVTPVDPALLEASEIVKLRRDPAHTKQPEAKGDRITTLNNLSSSDKTSSESSEKAETKKKKKSRLEIWEDAEESGKLKMEGKIVELHSNVGRLQGTDGNQHFFARENSYLYGVCLCNVELWHVLVQDETVTYSLSEISPGETKVGRMWIGPETVKSEEAAAHIYEWCSKNLVPEGARELLIHALEVEATKDPTSDTKDAS